MSVEPRNALERSIFASAYVSRFDDLHAAGVHAQFRKDYANVTVRVAKWEAWCADCALDEARMILQLYRKARGRDRRRA